MRFKCSTCLLVAEEEEMMKHLASTRHKTITQVLDTNNSKNDDNKGGESDTDIYCEECKNNNIHLLQIIRFGGQDMALLCNSCFHKEYSDSERPKTSYSLANGSILKFWGKYVTVRDCCCDKCGEENNLNVNSKRVVLCDSCLKKLPNDKDFTSEKTGEFLYPLLGIKEPSKSKRIVKRGGRRVGRGKPGKGKGKGKGKSTPGKNGGLRQEGNATGDEKKQTFQEKLNSDAYEAKKENTTIKGSTGISLRNFKGGKAVHASSERNNPSKNTFGASKGIKPRQSSNKSKSKNIHSSNFPSNGNHPRNTSDINHKKTAKKTLAIECRPDISNKAGYSKSNSRNCDDKTKKPVTFNASTPNTNGSNKKISNKKKETEKNIKQPIGNRINFDEVILNSNMISDPNAMRTSKNNSNNSKINDTPRKILTKKDPTVMTKAISDSDLNNSGTRNQDKKNIYEEGELIDKFKSYSPKLSYPDIETYCNVFSYALFLEQKLENEFLNDFEILWPRNSRETAFIVHISKNNMVDLQKVLPANLLALGRTPFNNMQPFFFCNHDESQVWYTYIKEIGFHRSKYILLFEVFSWNRINLPMLKESQRFKLLPASAQAHRILFAMTRIENTRFLDLILGQEPIKQIYFKNRLTFTKSTLNDSQKRAVEHVLNNRITVLKGPPGTGKTSTIEEIILQLIENLHTFPIICVAASNIAIDNIAEKIMTNRPKLKILRILSKAKEQQYDKDHPLGKICLHNIVYDQLPPELKLTADKVKQGRVFDISKAEDNKYYKERTRIVNTMVSQMQIIFTTNIASGGRELKTIKEIPVVIMDEATQSSEVSTLVPLSLPGIKKIVLVGDEKQLSSFSNIPQLEMSLFERILLNKMYAKPHLLDTQYRMHPSISEFPITKIYNNELQNGVTIEQKTWPDIKYPLFFYQCNKGLETKVRSAQRDIIGYTYQNKYESNAIKEMILALMVEKNVPLEEIGVVTPYSAQRDLISEILAENSIINPKSLKIEQEVDEVELFNAANVDVKASLHGNTINIVNGLHIATIDSFQGHEKSFIIFSCVRNNLENKIGFLKDRRRLNVALTRAKYGLVIVGNKEVLRRGDSLWKEYIEYLEEKQVIFDDLRAYV